MANEIYSVSYWGYSNETGFGSIYHSYTSEPVETPSEPVELPSEPIELPSEPPPKKK